MSDCWYAVRMFVVSRTARLSLIKIHLENTEVSLADEEWNMLIDKLEGYSGSDIRSVVIGALYEPVRSMQSAYHWKQNAGKTFHLRNCSVFSISLLIIFGVINHKWEMWL